MNTFLMPQPKLQFLSTLGLPLLGGKIYTYAAGGSVPKATYTVADGSASHTNPILLNVRGEPPAPIYWNGNYRVELRDALDNLIYTVDNFNTDPAGLQSILTSLAASGGAGLVGFIQTLAGAKQRTVAKKLGERVSVADFLDTDAPTAAQATTALQAAVNSGAKKIYIGADYTISAGITLAANQTIDFDGGSLTALAGGAYPTGVLTGNGKAGIRIIDPVIDSTALNSLRNISLINCPRGRIDGGYLTGGIIGLEGPNNATRMDYRVRGTSINAGFKAPCIYVSAVLGAVFEALVMTGGQEGVGIYNDSRSIKHTDCDSYSQIQDGFVIIAGQRINYANCNAYSNGQSGFTTQRQSAGTNTQRVTYSSCQAYDNAYDGFDLRGNADGSSWNADMMLSCVGCVSTNNTGTGFYVVSAEGTMLSGCYASNNQQQNFFLNGSNRVTLTGCESSSGANAVAAGANKAGIMVYNSSAVAIIGCHSSNAAGATQNYGVSFTGTSTACTVIGGYYENNSTAPYNMTLGNRFVAAQADTGGGSIFLREITARTTYDEEGFGIPAHVRPKGSRFMRVDGGNAELYLSNGAGAWYKLA